MADRHAPHKADHTNGGEVGLAHPLAWVGTVATNLPLSMHVFLRIPSQSLNILFQTWIGPVLLCINPFEAPGPAVHTVLKRLCESVLQDMASDGQSRALIFK